jgi:hypothetical protein
MPYMVSVPHLLITKGNIKALRIYIAVQQSANESGVATLIHAIEYAQKHFGIEPEAFEQGIEMLVSVGVAQQVNRYEIKIGTGVAIKQRKRANKKIKIEHPTRRLVNSINNMIVANHPKLNKTIWDRSEKSMEAIQAFINRSDATIEQLDKAAKYAANHKEERFSWAEQFRSVTKLTKPDKDGIPYYLTWLNKADQQPMYETAPYHDEFRE